MKIKTYPQMNETIKDLLRRSEEPMNLYILARIEDLEKQVKDLTPPPNGPLTLEELREMDGEPVWFCKCHNGLCNWCVIDHTNETNIFFTDGTVRLMSSYGDGWLAYRRRPEEEIT